LENLGEGSRRNRNISLLFKALDSFSASPTSSMDIGYSLLDIQHGPLLTCPLFLFSTV